MKDKIIKKEHLFFVGLLFYILRNFFAYTSYPIPNIILNLFWILTQVCWIFALVMRCEVNSRFIIEVALIAYAYYNLEITGSWNLLSLSYILFASRDIEVKKIIRFMYKILAFLLVLNIIWYAINYLLGNVTISQTREVNGEVVLRHNFYFNHANGLSLYIFFTVLMFMYLYYNCIRKEVLYTIIILSAVFVYVFPNTRTVALLFFLVILFDLPRGKMLDKMICFVCKHIYIISFVLIFTLVYLFACHPNAITAKVNDLMNGRLTLVAGAYKLYGINLLGHRIINEEVYLPGLGYFKLYIDNFYGMLLIRYGILATLLVSIVSIKTSKYLYKKKKRLELMLFTVVFIFGLSESTALDIFPVFPWLFFKEIYEKKRMVVENVRAT